MGDCSHPEESRRYAVASATFFCRVCNESVKFDETVEQKVARERKLYVLRPHTPK